MKIINARRILILVLLLLAIAFVPYLWSRLFSPMNRVSTHEQSNILPQKSIDNRIHFACYNIAHGRGLPFDNWNGESKQKRRVRLDAIAKLLKGIDADVVALNEVDFNSTWSHGINQAQYLAEQAGYQYWAEERNLDFRVATVSWCFGNAVLSKYPISDAEVIDFPSYQSWETNLAGKKRGLKTEIDFGNRSIQFVSAHLSHRSEDLRVASAKLLYKMAKASQDPFFIAGDFNSTPPEFPGCSMCSAGENAIAIFDTSSVFHRQPLLAPQPHEFTFPSDTPKSVIDWILIPTDCKFIDYSTTQSTLSDHLPVSATVQLGR